MRLKVDIEKKMRHNDLRIRFSIDSETMGVLGASGCGKSMLLKCIAGIESPDKGIIQLGDKILFDKEKGVNLPPQKRSVGLMFQQYALFPHFTVKQNIECAAENQSKVTEFLKTFQLEGLERCYPRHLSGGQKQRVAMARLMASNPDLLLFDEPFSALDAPLKEGLLLQLQKLMSHEERNVLIVSHSLDELYRLCPKISIMTDKEVVMGETKEIFKNPVTIQAAKLTGCKNIFPIDKLASHQLRVKGWSEVFTTDKKISEEITHIGIRARDFLAEVEGENQVEIEYIERQESPFEQSAWFSHGGDRIWWKGNKTAAPSSIRFFSVKPDAIMLLR